MQVRANEFDIDTATALAAADYTEDKERFAEKAPHSKPGEMPCAPYSRAWGPLAAQLCVVRDGPNSEAPARSQVGAVLRVDHGAHRALGVR